MSFRVKRGDIFDQPMGTVLVCPVNTVGVMGAGLAPEFARRVPGLEDAYKQACEHGNCRIGRLYRYANAGFRVICFPTKADWRKPSSLEYIEEGLQDFERIPYLDVLGKIAWPQLGCGLGGLDWKEVEPLMLKYLDPLPVENVVMIRRDET